MKLQIWFLALFTIFFNQPLKAERRFIETAHISKAPITQLELDIIKYGDEQSKSRVLGRLAILHKEKGTTFIYSAIPIMNELLIKYQVTNESHKLENNLVNFLGQIGDSRSRQVLLNSVKRSKGNSAIGLSKMDSGVIDSVITYLHLPTIKGRGKAAHTLRKMYGRNPDLFTAEQISTIRRELVSSLNLYSSMGAQCLALSVFGDKTTLPILTRVATTDTLNFNGVYANKDFARYAIDQINQR
ncbi:MAG: hypothetical protein OXR72_14580 [Gemmatimonadota bacterium]|nr:hypothetical protein [Gemmatimonadota bacterium]